MLLITGARLGDDYGHRRLFLLGLTAFTAASLACGEAPSGAFLIVARVIQGAGCALMTPQVATIIQLNYEGAARARAMALFATVPPGGVVAGRVLGGLLVSADIGGLSWRPVFLVNVPIGVTLLVVGSRTLPATRAPKRQRLAPPAGRRSSSGGKRPGRPGSSSRWPAESRWRSSPGSTSARSAGVAAAPWSTHGSSPTAPSRSRLARSSRARRPGADSLTRSRSTR